MSTNLAGDTCHVCPANYTCPVANSKKFLSQNRMFKLIEFKTSNLT